jgi:hypothetical protein
MEFSLLQVFVLAEELFMISSALTSTHQTSRTARIPRFNLNQTVRFTGGCGKIKTYKPNSGTWAYTIEMELGPEPEIGRVGFETTVLLDEVDIQSVVS